MPKFQKGESGNPKGRPKGIVDRRTKFRDQIEEHIPAIVEQVVIAALSGDMTACKLLLDKVLPNIRPQSLPLRLSPGGKSDVERACAITDGLLKGDLSPEQAAAAMTVIVDGARLRELVEFETRLEALERQSGY